jgi:hypothetical protein
MRIPRHRAVIASSTILVAVGLIAGYVWFRDGSGKVVAKLQSAPVGDMGISYVTWDGEVVLIIWRDFALT